MTRLYRYAATKACWHKFSQIANRLCWSPDSFEYDKSCSRLQDLKRENLLLESTCTNWGYTCAAEEPAEYPAGATEEQKQVFKRFENMRCFVLKQ